ncbi:hypothetical protein TNCV_4757991 [Trichonephila clavipes]|nr:hypothetical protein TNCV_4757991 [Trichonephila clavipes]
MAPWARRLRCVLALDKCVQMWTRNYGALGQTARVCFGVLCANRTREVKRDFGDLSISRSEGRVVNTPLAFKRVLFGKKRAEKKDKRDRERERTGGDPGDPKKEGRKWTTETRRENGRKEEERRKRERGDGKRLKESRRERERVKPALNGKKG